MRYHVIWHTYGSWLPGDPRGFRTKHHRLHVEGDYRSPPPRGSYEGLHRHARGLMKGPAIVIPQNLRSVVGQACLARFAEEGAAVCAASIGGRHTHVAFGWATENIGPLIGRVKKVSSHRVRSDLPGRIWARGCKIIMVRDQRHWAQVLRYIKGHAVGGSWVWPAEGC